MFMRFLLIGGLGFVIDASVTYMLIVMGFAPWLARIPAILLAMVFTWLGNRQFTYKVKQTRSAAEAMRYAFTAIAMALVNYATFVVLVSYGMWPVAAVIVATACQTILSFHAYRSLVFKDAEKC